MKEEMDMIGGMLIDIKKNVSTVEEGENYNMENPLFLKEYRDKQVE